jgi:aminocarboxymuconate-semialdehyde decarboxylase
VLLNGAQVWFYFIQTRASPVKRSAPAAGGTMGFFTCGCGVHMGRRGALQAVLAGAATLAGAGGAAAQASRPRVINTHAHFYPRSFLDVIRAEGGPYKAEWHDQPDGAFVITAPLGRAGPLPAGMRDVDIRIRDMDRQGVDIQAVSLSNPMTYWADAALSNTLCRAWNDGAAAAHLAHPTRLLGLLSLPMLDEGLALAELDRARRLPGMKGVYVGTNINGLDVAEKRFLPIWKAIEAAGLPAFLHPLQTIPSPRLQPYYFGNLIGNPLDTAIAAGNLIMGGVLDACPTLEVNLPHAGGVLPILIGRWDHGARVRPELKHMTRPPSDYLRRFTYDTVSHSADVMKFVISQVGVDRITLGDDYYFDMGDAEPVGVVDALGLNPQERAMVLGGNAAKLLKLG